MGTWIKEKDSDTWHYTVPNKKVKTPYTIKVRKDIELGNHKLVTWHVKRSGVNDRGSLKYYVGKEFKTKKDAMIFVNKWKKEISGR